MSLKLKKRGEVWWVHGTIDGRRYRESAKTRSRDAAEEFRKQAERRLESRAIYGARKFSDAVIYYLEQKGDPKFTDPIVAEFGKLEISDITPQMVSSFGARKFGHLKPSSLKRVLYTPLNAVINRAFKAEMCAFKRFTAPKFRTAPVQAADDDWFRTFLARAPARIALTVTFLSLSAARVTEACNLTVGDLYLGQGFAMLRITKNGKARRVVLQPLLVELLQQWLSRERSEAETAEAEEAGETGKRESVFGYASRFSVNQAIERVCGYINRDAGKPVIRYMSSHKVGRHAFAARHLAEGRSLKFVQEGGGWSSIRIVSDSYGHMEQSQIDQAIRESGQGLLSALTSKPLALPAPKKNRHKNGTKPKPGPRGNSRGTKKDK